MNAQETAPGTACEAYTKEQAKASDKRLAELLEARDQADKWFIGALDTVHWLVGDRPPATRPGRIPMWKLSEEEAVAKLAEIVAATGRIRESEALDQYQDLKRKHTAAVEAFSAHSREWREHGQWSRFALVQDGHIHSSPRCHTIRRTTKYALLPELSGESEADAVAVHGPRLCTHCFPTAPVEWTIEPFTNQIRTNAPAKATRKTPSGAPSTGRASTGTPSARAAEPGKTSPGPAKSASTKGRRRNSATCDFMSQRKGFPMKHYLVEAKDLRVGEMYGHEEVHRESARAVTNIAVVGGKVVVTTAEWDEGQGAYSRQEDVHEPQAVVSVFR